MESPLLTIIATIALVTTSLAADEKTIDAKDAARHGGKKVVVHGIATEVHSFKDGSVVLDFGAKYPNEVFEVYVAKSLADATGDMHEYAGKAIMVERKIELYKGKPEINLDDAGQLRQ